MEHSSPGFLLDGTFVIKYKALENAIDFDG
jgi:hypothetical protein